jgi:hypothetical protein
MVDMVEHAITLNVTAGDFFGSGRLPTAAQGRVLIRSKWHIESGNDLPPAY